MQDPGARLSADDRVRSLAGKRVWQVVLVGASLTLICVGLVHAVAFTTTSDTGTRALANDFRVFWAAARLALQGEALAAFDLDRLAAVHGVNPGEWMPWLYPPGYLVLILPLGAMSFATAFLVSNLLSVALLALALRPFVPGAPVMLLALALAPAVLPALLLGQNSLIWLAGLVAALAALRDGRWVIAGVLVGCLTLKPQLGVMIAVALVAAGLWRTVLAASLTAAGLALLPTLAFGLDYWSRLLERLADQSARLVQMIADLFLMVGPFFLLARAGVPADVALGLQLALAATAGVLVWLLWRSPRAGFDERAAGLLIAILLSAPYLWYYEAAAMPVIGLFLLRAGALRPDGPQLILALLLWSGAALQAIAIFLNLGDGRHLGATVVTPTLFASAALLFLHILATGRRAPQTATS
jgi:hypothetical protein